MKVHGLSYKYLSNYYFYNLLVRNMTENVKKKQLKIFKHLFQKFIE